jgi:transposase-like protein
VSKRLSVDELIKGRHFGAEIIVLCVRWYLGCKLSYRDLAGIMAERGVSVAPSTILRWVQHYALCAGVREALESLRTPRLAAARGA